ncbi:auxin efflux carrier [Ewingella americana]|uniref:Auxin efflux carrier n=1 Tax=Ewingella americana TaxID=41202 RepID=A0A377NGG8_9GAMM|nr:auxin efflux carrier [Ewingella americana]
MFWETWSFAFGVTVPNLLILILGMWLRRTGLMDDSFNEKASRLVFNIALPCLLFFSVAQGHDTSVLTCRWPPMAQSAPSFHFCC